MDVGILDEISPMKWRTTLNLSHQLAQIKYQEEILMLGSCFAENIGSILSGLKYQAAINPWGIIYNPVVLSQNMQAALQGINIEEEHLLEHPDGGYTHWSVHSRIKAMDKIKAVQKIEEAYQEAHRKILSSQYLILTFGTAYYYEHEQYGMVANCHKYPQKHFSKKMHDANSITTLVSALIRDIRARNPKLKVLISVSPVRHIKDGIIENNLSKAQLITAAHSLCQQLRDCRYIPSYEWLIDDLRDYRYFAEDMVHPSTQAIQYIWKQLEYQLLDKAESSLRDNINKIITASAHRPFNPNSEAHQSFCKKQLDRIQAIDDAYPYIDLSKERQHFTEIIKE